MGTFFNELSDPLSMNLWVLIFKLMLAVLLGGLVGFERGFHGRAAGLRTHMLVSMGAALTAIVGIALSLRMHELDINSDAARISAQVVTGVGFLGAGTILLKGNSQVTGLTTAAGLWATAAIGLAIGSGLYIVSIAAAVICVFAFTVLSRLEFKIRYKRQRLFIYVEIDSVAGVKEITSFLNHRFQAVELSVTPPRSGTQPHVGVEALVRLPANFSMDDCAKETEAQEHVVFVLNV